MTLLRMPIRFARGGALRVMLTVVALAFGVALVCAIDLANRAVYSAFQDAVETMAGRAALQVTAGGGALFDEEVARTIAGVPGVELAVPVVSSWAFTRDDPSEQLTVHGIDIASDAAIRTYEPSDKTPYGLEDPVEFLSRRDSVILTEAFAARHHLELNDPLEVDTPTGSQRFVVRALLAPQGIGRLQGGNLLVMDIGAAQLAFARRGLVTRVDVVVMRDADLGTVRDAVTGVLSAGLRVDAPEQRRMDMQRVMRSIQVLLEAVGVFGLFAAFLIAFSRLSTVYEARLGQLSVLRAVGVRARRVWWELVKESLLVAAGGIALGIPGGILLGHAVLPVVATATAIGAKMVTADAHLVVRPESIVLASALGLAAVVLAAIVPARRAARVPVAETLRYRQAGVEDREESGPLAPMFAVLVGCAGAMVAVHLYTESAVAGLAASALVVMVAAMATRPVLGRLEGLLRHVGPRIAGASGRYAVSALARAPRRTALTVATLGVGFGTALWLWTLAGSFERSVVEVMPGVLRGDLAVSSANVAAGYVEAPLDESILGDLLEIPGVTAVVGEQTADWYFAEGPIAINAFDPPYFATTEFGNWRLTGRALPGALEAVARGDGVLVSENFVHNIDAAVGEVLALETPTGPISMRIVGATPDFLSPRGTILMSRAVYQERWRDGHITHALVETDRGVDVEEVRSRLIRALGSRHRVRVLRVGELVDWFASQARQAFHSLDVLGALVVLVVLVGVGDAQAASMIERTRELGVLRAIGVRRRALRHMILGEALVLGVLGMFSALALGLGLGVLWVEWTFPALLGWTLSLHLPTRHIVHVAIAATIVCLVAAWAPAARAARRDPVVALRTE